MRVGDLMKRQVVCCVDADTLEDATTAMRDHDIGALPVLDGGGRLVDMLTDRDVALAALHRRERLADIPVREVATGRPVWTCQEDQALDDAEARMADHQVSRLPVLADDGRLVGILSLSDLAEAASDFAEDCGLSSIHVARTLRAVCARRVRA